MKLYKTHRGTLIEEGGHYMIISIPSWDRLFQEENIRDFLHSFKAVGKVVYPSEVEKYQILKPVGNQEIWAAGVTYFRSMTARMEESLDGGSCYDRVYQADRPELFFKATPSRCVGPGEKIGIRKDSTWNVPEPELTLAINSQGKIFGYTIGNDMSSRSIEGENPLYLPQAKTYEKCAALGPCIYVPRDSLPDSTVINLDIVRNKKTVFKDGIKISQMKRKPQELADFLFRECKFPSGCFLMTGTGIVPPDDFTILPGDIIKIAIDPIGELVNTVDYNDVKS